MYIYINVYIYIYVIFIYVYVYMDICMYIYALPDITITAFCQLVYLRTVIHSYMLLAFRIRIQT